MRERKASLCEGSKRIKIEENQLSDLMWQAIASICGNTI